MISIWKQIFPRSIQNNHESKSEESNDENDQNNNTIDDTEKSMQIFWNDKRILENYMLSDNEIHAALEILKKQFKNHNLKGFFDPQSMKMKKLKKFSFHVQFPDRFIQILHDGKLHWYTITNIKSNNFNQIQSYDSLYADKTYIGNSMLRTSLTKMLFQKPLDETTRPNGRINIECSIEPVQKQSDLVMCGLFAIAFAFDLCQNIDPTIRCYDESQMRQHLLKCLNQHYFQEFPQLNKEAGSDSPPRQTAQIIFIDI